METAHTASVQGFTRKISAGKKAKKEKTKAPAVPCDSCQDGVGQTDSDDDDIRKIAHAGGISVVRTSDLPLPPEDPQTSFIDELRGNGEKDDENEE